MEDIIILAYGSDEFQTQLLFEIESTTHYTPLYSTFQFLRMSTVSRIEFIQLGVLGFTESLSKAA